MVVSPTDANTIALAAQWSLCSGDGCTGQPVEVYISHDSGANWTLASLMGGLRDWGLSVWLAWMGASLFVGTNGDSVTENQGQAHPVIAARVNGAPFASVGGAALGNLTRMRLAGFLRNSP